MEIFFNVVYATSCLINILQYCGDCTDQSTLVAMMYSDFHYRPPPPTYQASMQEYRLRMLLLDNNRTGATANTADTNSPPRADVAEAISPPPLYRAQLR